jgi:hypothetical protein
MTGRELQAQAAGSTGVSHRRKFTCKPAFTMYVMHINLYICVQQILALIDWAVQLNIAFNRVLSMPAIRACVLPLAEQCAYGGYVEGAVRRSCSLTSTKASTTPLCTHHSPLTMPFYPDEIGRAKPGQLGSGPARYASTAGEETRSAI